MFTVPKKDGSLRLVLDLSLLNKHIEVEHFKMDNQVQARQLLVRNDWLTALDIQDAYLHVPVLKRLHRFLSFSWQGETYSYQCLPFGLNVAPRSFTKLMTFPRKILGEAGISALFYLDDILLWSNSEDKSKANTQKAMEVLSSLGFLLNQKKSKLTPTQELDWLGLKWNTRLASVGLPLDKQVSLQQLVSSTVQKESLRLISWQQLLGALNFASQALPLGRLRFRALVLHSPSPAFQGSPALMISDHLRRALLWWTRPMNLSLSSPWRPPHPSLIVWSDASDKAWGLVSSLGHKAQGLWNHSDSLLHITAKELKAVLFLMDQPWIAGHTSVILRTDCISAMACIKRQGSTRSPVLQEISAKILVRAMSMNLSITAQHIIGATNVTADLLSRTDTVATEWTISVQEFRRLQLWHGPLQVDMFASPENNKLDTFVSPYDHPDAVAVDALSLDWRRWQQLYLFPPPRLLPKVVPLLLSANVHGILVAPAQPQAPWFASLVALCLKSTPIRGGVTQMVQGVERSDSPPSYSGLTAYSF